MLVAVLKTLFDRDLNKLSQEIEAYQDENALWRTEPGISNSGGNLCLHLLGNLNTYIGAELGHSGYVRHRDLEFSARDIPRTELLAGIAATRRVVEAALTPLADEQLAAEYPVLVFEARTSVGYMLMHLATHLTYHLGQINYHRRLLDKNLPGC
ncbi:DinB family protein [Hymenobacter sp. BT770]|uniref:DinB family protein n=1 Tax=Hymenobacter sp. BT770 TaxID=2886942 RepID=UPI001D12EF19|nr:DinB family protein [Hymenobacter sp. BT770]MCC3153290.1 DinB family protein [Hymenobacter sp. BT770]MDO3414285.1 DinB family protein [Hymenobacter sp. BT770]